MSIRKFIQVALLSFCALLFTAAHAQVQVSPKYSVDGDINAIVSKGDTVYFGGTFSSIGTYTGGGALLSVVTPTADLNFPKLIGSIVSSTSDGAGGFYVYGNFYKESESSASTSNRIEHIRGDNSFEPGFSLNVDASFGLSKILYHNGLLFIAGNRVNFIAGQPAADLCAVDVATKTLVSWMPAVVGGYGINSISAIDNTLYVSGNFTTIGGIARNGNAAIRIPTGDIKPWQPNINGGFSDTRFYNNMIILGGGFFDPATPAPGNRRHSCALVDTNTGASVSYVFDNGTTTNELYHAASVHSVALIGDTLFCFSGGTYDTRITAIDLAHGYTVLWKKFFNMIGVGREMAAVPGKLFVAGNFGETFITNLDNNSVNLERKITGLISLDTRTGNLGAWNAEIMGNVKEASCITLSGTKIFAGGKFSHVNGKIRKNVFALDVAADTLLPFNVNFDWTTVHDLQVSDTTLYVGGGIGYIGTVNYDRPVMAFSTNTSALLPWQPAITGTAYALCVNGDMVFIGGSLDEAAGGTGRKNLFAANKATAVLAAWNPNPNNRVHALHAANSRIYAGGEFSDVDGQTRNHLAAFDSATLALGTWNPNADGTVFDIKTADTLVWVAGNFGKVGDSSLRLLAGVGAQSGIARVVPAKTGVNGDIRTLAVKDKWVLAGGSFNWGASIPCNNLLMYNTVQKTVSTPSAFCVNFESGTLYSMLLHKDDLYFGGRFLKINSKARDMNLSRLRYPSGFFGGESGNDTISFYPKSAGNGGNVTVRFYGALFQSGVHVKFVRSGYSDIDAIDSFTTFPALNEMSAVFNLSNASVGYYDVYIISSNGNEVKVPNGFKVDISVPPAIVVQIIGPNTMRTGQFATFIIQLWNTGNNDAYGIPVFIFVRGNDTVSFKDIFYAYTGETLPGLLETRLENFGGSIGETKAYLPLIPKIPANSSINIPLYLKPHDNNGTHTIDVIPNKPIIPAPQQRDNNGNVAVPPNVSDCMTEYAKMAIEYGANNAEDYVLDAITPGLSQVNAAIECAQGLQILGETSDRLISEDANKALDAAHSFGSTILKCGTFFLPGFLPKIAELMYESMYVALKCADDFNPNKKGDKFSSNSSASYDPNDKIGTGINARHFVTGENPLPYGIRFENVDTAGLPAQIVRIVDTLDKERLDLSTFRLNFFQIGGKIVNFNAAKGLNAHYMDLRPAKNMMVKVETALDNATGIFTATFTSIDPVTMLPITNPLDGFLPPNVNSPEGEGAIYFSVHPKAGLPNLAEIKNTAHIYFDVNDAIVTPTWVNTLDKLAPNSKMALLPAKTTDTAIMLKWDGRDGESGVEKYDIYYAEDRGAYQLYASNVRGTSLTFPGKVNSTYSFYCIATDSVGHREAKTDTAEATTSIVPEEISVYPNPATDKITVRLRQDITFNELSVFNVQGRRIPVSYTVTGNVVDVALGEHVSGLYIMYVATSEKKYIYKIVLL